VRYIGAHWESEKYLKRLVTNPEGKNHSEDLGVDDIILK
jgi:hypothetical protein